MRANRRRLRWRYPWDYGTDDRGVALIIVLFVVSLVTILVLEYHYDAAVELELADNYANEVRAYHLAMSGLRIAQAVLAQDNNEDYDAADENWNQLAGFGCLPPPQLLAMFQDVKAAPGNEATRAADEPPAPACVQIRIVDESRKLPLNALVPPDQGFEPEPNPWREIFERFFGALGIDTDVTDLVDALVDWMDWEARARGSKPGGAEDEYYESLDPAYQTRDRPIEVPGELRLVRYFDCELLAKLFRPEKECKDMADIDLGSNAYLTPYGGGPDNARVNLNTADPEVIQAITNETVDGPCVTEIMDRRPTEEQQADGEPLPIKDLTQDLTSCGDPETLQQFVGVTSTTFRVESQGEIEGKFKKKVVAVLERGAGDNADSAFTMVYFKVE